MKHPEHFCPYNDPPQFCACYEAGIAKMNLNIGMLRQWLNECRITAPGKMVTSEQIKKFINWE